MAGSDHDSAPAGSTGDHPETQSRLRRLRSRIDTQVTRSLSLIEERRPSSRPLEAAFRIVDHNRVFPVSLLAGALASRLVLFLIPLLVLVVVAFGFFAEVAAMEPREAARQAGIAGLFAQAVDDAAVSPSAWRLTGLVTATLAVLWAANTVGRLLRRVHAMAWEVVPSPIRWWTVPVSVVATTLFAMVWLRVDDVFVDLGVTGRLLQTMSGFTVMAAGWLIVSWALPRAESATWRDLLPGAVLFGIGAVVLQTVTATYLAVRIEAMSERYGSLAVVLVMLGWAYLLGLTIVLAAELNAALFRIRVGNANPHPVESS